MRDPIIVHSHLRWDFVWQRPQQLLSRMSERTHVLFVEEPVYATECGLPRIDLTNPCAQLYRAVPVLPDALRDRYEESIAVVRELVGRQICDDGALGGLFQRPVQWFYTPMPAPAFVGAFDERAIVYDCMDELSKFRFAPAELIDREKLLMSEADVIFAGGYNLSQSKSRHHHNVHFFGCGVDLPHFSAARTAGLPVHREVAEVPGPVAGYYGVIDERIDYVLLASLAAALPELTVVMVGPVVKVSADELPQASNIRWLGQKEYADLPACVKGFDVCLMPFALNDATEFINPTKTLEYMAAGKPIVSTAVADVVHNFTPVVSVARTHEEFIALVSQAIREPDGAMLERGLDQARANSWEGIVARMERILRDAIATREHTRRERVAASPRRERTPDLRPALVSSQQPRV